MLNKNLEPQVSGSPDIRLYETFVAKGFTKEEAKEVITDFMELTKRTGTNIETKFDAKLDLILARIDAVEGKLKLGFGWAVGLMIATFVAILAGVLALVINH